MPAPLGISPELASYLQRLEDRVAKVETPGSPTLVFACLKANLPDPVANINRVAQVTDTNILVASDGTHWINQNTGAPV
jgi:hypothetical protein